MGANGARGTISRSITSTHQEGMMFTVLDAPLVAAADGPSSIVVGAVTER